MAHGVIVESAVSDAHEDARAVHEGCRAFDHMEAGLQYCEERFLEVSIHFVGRDKNFPAAFDKLLLL